MTRSRFETAARSLAVALPRRRLLESSSGGLAALLGALLPASVSARCRKLGRPCQTNGQCCPGSTCRGQVCRCSRHWSTCGSPDKCFPLLLDPRNCGTCGNNCLLLGTICNNGVCA